MPKGVYVKPQIYGWQRRVLDMYPDNILCCYMGNETYDGGTAVDSGPNEVHGVYTGTTPAPEGAVDNHCSRLFSTNIADLRSPAFRDTFNPNLYSMVVWAKQLTSDNNGQFLLDINMRSANYIYIYEALGSNTLKVRSQCSLLNEHSMDVPSGWFALGISSSYSANAFSLYKRVNGVFSLHDTLPVGFCQPPGDSAKISMGRVLGGAGGGGWSGYLFPLIIWTGVALTAQEMEYVMTP